MPISASPVSFPGTHTSVFFYPLFHLSAGAFFTGVTVVAVVVSEGIGNLRAIKARLTADFKYLAATERGTEVPTPPPHT